MRYAVRLLQATLATRSRRWDVGCSHLPAIIPSANFVWQRSIYVLAGDGQDREMDKKYVDRLKVTARGGNGGKGCVSFWRSASKGKFTPADGGDGGDGGNVILRASSQMKSLSGVPQLIKGEPGKNGSKQKQHGRRGQDAVILVPLGTVVSRPRKSPEELEAASKITENNKMNPSEQHGVKQVGQQRDGEEEKEEEEELPDWLAAWRAPWVGSKDYASGGDDDDVADYGISRAARTREADQDLEIVADLVEDGQEAVVARGGYGGRGNAAMRALPRRPAPSASTPPQPGENSRLSLELKLLADIALVGLPNVGKSSLLRVLSAATPRVADFAFTTVSPQLGSIPLEDGRRIVVADVPGLIEGAHTNRGLGLRFLRHVERTAALAFVVDAAGSESPQSGGGGGGGGGKRDGPPKLLSPAEQLALLRSEVGHYSPELLHLPWMVVANKIDLLARPTAVLRALEKKVQKQQQHESRESGGDAKVKVVGVSATGGSDISSSKPKRIDMLVQELVHLVQEARR